MEPVPVFQEIPFYFKAAGTFLSLLFTALKTSSAFNVVIVKKKIQVFFPKARFHSCKVFGTSQDMSGFFFDYFKTSFISGHFVKK